MSPLPTRTRYPGRSAAFHVDPSPRHPRVLGTPAATTFSREYTNRRQSAEALDANKDGKVDARDAAEVGRRCSPAKCVIS